SVEHARRWHRVDDQGRHPLPRTDADARSERDGGARPIAAHADDGRSALTVTYHEATKSREDHKDYFVQRVLRVLRSLSSFFVIFDRGSYGAGTAAVDARRNRCPAARHARAGDGTRDVDARTRTPASPDRDKKPTGAA